MSKTLNFTDSTSSPISAPLGLHILRRALCGATALTAAATLAPLASAQDLPTGGNVVDGAADISSDTTSVTIDQTSDRVVIDWADFDIAAGNRVDFHQPGADAWALNRDLSGAASHIHGTLSANGNVVLQNRHGVHFGATAQIEVNSIIATTHDIDNADFMAGDMTFGIPGESDAMVTNDGSITVNDGGLAALVAPAVSNSGMVRAREGTVVLAAGETATYDFYGDGLINIAVTAPTTEVPVGPDGQPVEALVANAGAVYADGGTVILTASQLESVVVGAINLDGIVQANGITAQSGQVALVSDTGTITVSGTVTADGTGADQSGGTVQIAGPVVEIAPTAVVSASGPAAGGAVLVGADDSSAAADRALGVSSGQGDGLLISLDRTLAELSNAPATEAVTVEAGADIAADGGSDDGGYVDIWADNALLVAGMVTADSTQAAGGDITMTAGTMSLTGAYVSASGATQGGEIDLGGEYQGSGTLAHATMLTVDETSTVSAIATDADGYGGSIVLWSTDRTETYGSLQAGPTDGFIEISSKGDFVAQGDVFAGVGGHLLLDPTEVLFVDGGPNALGGTQINPAWVASQLDLGTSITVKADNQIIVAGEIISARDNVSLILEAGGGVLFQTTVVAPSVTTLDPFIQLTGSGSVLRATSNMLNLGENGRGSSGSATFGGISTVIGSDTHLEAETIEFIVSDAGNSGSPIRLIGGTIIADNLILDVRRQDVGRGLTGADIAVGPFVTLTAGRLTARAQDLSINIAGQVGSGTVPDNSRVNIGTLVEATTRGDFVIVNAGGLEVAGPVSADEVEFRLGGDLTMTDDADAGITASVLEITAATAGVIAYNAESSDLILDLSGAGSFDLRGSSTDSVNVFGTVAGALSLLGDDAVSIIVGDQGGNTGLTVGGDFAVNAIAGMTQTAAMSAGTLTGSSYGDIVLSTHDNLIGGLRDFVGLVPTGGLAPDLFALRSARDLNFGRDDPNGGLSGFTTVNLTLEDLLGTERFNFIGVQNFQPRISAEELTIVAGSIVDLLEFAATKDGATLELDLAAPPDTERDSEINIAVADADATTALTVNVFGQVTSDSADPGLILKSDSLVAINVGDGGTGTMGLTVDGTLSINGDAGITQDDPITATRLAFTSFEDVLLSNDLNDIDRLLASSSQRGDVTLTDTGDLELDGAVTTLGTLTLNVGGALTDSDGTVVIDGLEVPNPDGGGYLLAPFVNVNAASAGAFGAPIRIYARPDSAFLVADFETLSLDTTQLFDPFVTLGLSGDGFFDFLVTNDLGLPTSLDDLLNSAFPNDPDGLEEFKRSNPDLIAFLERIDFEIGVRRFNVAGTVSNGSDLTLTGGEAPLVVNNTILDAGDDSVLLVFDDGDDSNSGPALTVDGTLTLNGFTSVTQAGGEHLVVGELEGFVLGDIILPTLSNAINALGTLVSVDGAIDIDNTGNVELTGVVYSSVLVDLFLLGGDLTNESEDGSLSPFLPDGVLAPRFNLRASSAGSADAGVNVLALPNITDGPIVDLLPAGTFDDPIVDLDLSDSSYLNLLVINTNPVTVNGVPYLQTDTGFDTAGFAPLTFGDRTFNVLGEVSIGEGAGPSLTLTGGEISTVNFLGNLPVLFDDAPTLSDLLEVVLGGAVGSSPYAFPGPLPASEEIAGAGSVVVNIGDGGDGTEGLLVDNVLTINNALRVIQDDVLTVRTLSGSTIDDGTVVLTAFGNTVRNLGDFDTGNGDFSLSTLGNLELAGLVSNGLGTTTLIADLDLTDEEDDGDVDAVRSAALVITAIDAGSADAPIEYQPTGSVLDLSLNGDGFFDLINDPGGPAVDLRGFVLGELELDGGNTVTVNIGSNGTGLTVDETLRIVDVAAMTQTAGLAADILTGDTGGGSVDLSLDGANDINVLEWLSTGNGDLSLSDIDDVELVGLVDAGTGAVSLVLGGDLTTGDNGLVQAADLILTAANAGSELAPIVYTATGSRLELDLSGDGTFILEGETTNVHGFVDGILTVFSEATTMNIGDGDGTLLEGPGEGALVIGEEFTTEVSELTEEDCLFVGGDGPCGPIEDFNPTPDIPPATSATLDTPSILLATFGDEAFDATLGDELLTPGDAAFRASEFTTPTVADLFDLPFSLGTNAPADPAVGTPDVTDLAALAPAAGDPDASELAGLAPAAGPSEESCVSAFLGNYWSAEEACQ